MLEIRLLTQILLSLDEIFKKMTSIKKVFILLLVVILSESCINKKGKISEDIKMDTIQPNIRMIDKGGIILPDKRDEL